MDYNYVKTVNAEKLKQEIKDLALSQSMQSMTVEGDNVKITYATALLTAEETSLNDLLTAHTTANAIWQNVDATLEAVEEFTRDLRRAFIRANIEWGITQQGYTRQVGKMLQELAFWLDQQSLYEAIDEVDIIIGKIQDPVNTDFYEIAPFITVDRLNEFKTQIQSFLGV